MARKELRNISLNDCDLEDFEEECLSTLRNSTSQKMSRNEMQKQYKESEQKYRQEVKKEIRNQGNLDFGRQVEDCVEDTLKTLHKLGLIMSYERSLPDSFADRAGIDFYVIDLNKREHSLQVKASNAGKQQHLKKYGNSIPCIVIRPSYSTFTIARHVEDALGVKILKRKDDKPCL